MAEQTTPQDAAVSQEQPSVEERLVALFGRQEKEQANDTEAPEQSDEAPAAEQASEQPQTDELTPDDLPDDSAPTEASAVDAFEIVHNGTQHRLTRAQTIEYAQKGFDYTQKTQELAQQRAAIASNLQRSMEAVQLAPLVAQDLATVKALEAQLAQYQKVDWVQLATADPLEYPKHRAQYDTLVSAYQGAVAQFRQAAGALTQHQQQARQELLQAEYPKLLQRVPEWRDPERYKSGAREVADYLVSEGADPNIVASLSDAIAVSVARKAMLYDRLQKAKAEKVKLARQAPPVTKPGAAQTPSGAKADADMQARARLKKTGDMRDAVAVYLNRMK